MKKERRGARERATKYDGVIPSEAVFQAEGEISRAATCAEPRIHREALRGTRSEHPRIGVIHRGTPKAFSFGRTPGDSRVVVSTGVLDILMLDALSLAAAVAGWVWLQS